MMRSLLLFLILTFAASAPAADKPNVVFILVDDLGYNDATFSGGDIPTPHLDRLAGEGALLTQFYVQPTCTQTRAALLTGRYPYLYGLQRRVIWPWSTYGLPLDEPTLAERLSEAGYRTMLCGKWHLGHAQPEFLPHNRGFDHAYGNYMAWLDYFSHTINGAHDWHRNGRHIREAGYATTLVGEEAARLIREQPGDQPFFLYLPFQAPHSPLMAPAEYRAQFEGVFPEPKQTYAAMIAALDDAVGEVAGALEERGFGENTLLVFASDNGGDHENGSSNAPLRGQKGDYWDGGIRSAAFARWPGRIPAGTEIDALLHVTDWAPTILALAGIENPDGPPMSGHDIRPVLFGGAPSPRTGAVHGVEPESWALRQGDFKLVFNGRRPGRQDGATDTLQLYDMTRPNPEMQDLAAEMPAVVAEMKSRMDEVFASAVPALYETDRDSREFIWPERVGDPLRFDWKGRYTRRDTLAWGFVAGLLCGLGAGALLVLAGKRLRGKRR